MSEPAPLPPAWLRGPVEGVPELLQPVAHALLDAVEEVERSVADLTPEQLARRPGGAASLLFHLAHLAGSTDRLFTYARGEELGERQRRQLEREKQPAAESAGALLAELRQTVARCLEQLRALDPAALTEPRAVGRARLPSTVLGLLVHAAEHAQRQVGQVVVTAKVVRAEG